MYLAKMLGSINIRDTRTKTRTRIDNIDLSGTIQILKERAAEITRVDVQDQQMVYCGRLLEDKKTLQSQGLADGVTIYLFEKKAPRTEPLGKDVEKVKPMQLKELIEKAMNNNLYQASVIRVLHDTDAMEQLIVATPSLKKDPVALSLLQDPELLLQVAETANIEKIIEEHPALAQAASHVMAAVKEDTKAQSSHNITNLESAEMEDLERMDPGLIARAEMVAAQEEGIQERQSVQPQQISPAQLAMALSQAGVTGTRNPEGGLQPGQNTQPQSLYPQPAQPAMNSITSDFFSQAIASALAATPITANQSQASNQTTNQLSHQAALEQMHAMGITNDSLSTQALQQTGGDVEAALALIFEGGMD